MRNTFYNLEMHFNTCINTFYNLKKHFNTCRNTLYNLKMHFNTCRNTFYNLKKHFNTCRNTFYNLKMHFNTCRNTFYHTPALVAQSVECPLRGTGSQRFCRHTKVFKNGTSFFSLGCLTYGVELRLVDPMSG